MKTIYIDSLFLINLAVNYLILLATARLCGHPLHRWRLGLGAAVGGLYAVLAVVPGTAFLAGAAMKLLSAVLMLLIAFGGKKKLLRTGIVFLAVSAAFGGAVYAVSLLGGTSASAAPFVPISLRVLLLSFAVCYVLISLVFRQVGQRPERQLLEVEVIFLGRRAVFRALRDTGNQLSDPVTGSPVLVAEPEALAPLFTPEIHRELERVEDPVECLVLLGRMSGAAGRFRLVPYTAVGVDAGVLVCFRPDRLQVNGCEEKDMLVALSRTVLCPDGAYGAIL